MTWVDFLILLLLIAVLVLQVRADLRPRVERVERTTGPPPPPPPPPVSPAIAEVLAPPPAEESHEGQQRCQIRRFNDVTYHSVCAGFPRWTPAVYVKPGAAIADSWHWVQP